MAKRFRFTQPNTKTTKASENLSEESAIEWSDEDIEAMAETTNEDLDDVSDWLKRTGQAEAAAMFDAD